MAKRKALVYKGTDTIVRYDERYANNGKFDVVELDDGEIAEPEQPRVISTKAKTTPPKKKAAKKKAAKKIAKPDTAEGDKDTSPDAELDDLMAGLE